MVFIILNEKLEQIEILDQYESLIWTDRYSECGDFEIYTTVSEKLMEILKTNETLYLWSSLSNHLMILEQYEINSESEDGNKIIITGRSIESILDRRVIWNKTDIDGSLQDGVEKIINDNVILPVNEKRKISNFVFDKSTDPRITKLTLKGSYYGDTVYEFLKTICEENDIGFKTELVNDDEFHFSLYAGIDRSYDQSDNPYVIFSPDYQNLGGSNYKKSTSGYKNVAVIPDKNNDDNVVKYYEYDPNNISGINRREVMSNESATSADKTIGDKTLKDNKREEMFEGQIDSTRMFVYGKDFFIGDIVQIRNEYGIESTSRVTEIVINQDQDTSEMYPTFETVEKEDTK